MFSEFLDASERLYYLTFALEIEWYGDHTDGKYSCLLCHLSHYWSSTCTRAAAHSCGDEHHLGAVIEQMADVLDVRFRLLTSHFGLRTSAKSLAKLYLNGDG